MYDILIINGCIITVDEQHTLYKRGYIGVKGDRITDIGDMQELTELPQAKRVIDAMGDAILPGLVDAHGHAGHCLIKNLGEAIPDWEALAEDIYYRNTDDFFWYAEGALAAAERVKFGVTTAVSMIGSTPRIDRIEHVGAHFEGSIKTGIRQLSGIGCAYGAFPKVARVWDGDCYAEYKVYPEKAYETTELALKAYNGKHPRQKCIVAPGRMGKRPDESVEANISHNKEMYRLSQEYGVPLHTHAFGGDVQFLYDHTPEVLTPNLSLTHSTGYSQRELEILVETGAFVLHGPATHSMMRLRCPAFEMLEMGINLAVVADGTAPDRSFDLFRDMKLFQILHRGHFQDTKLLPCGTVLELCTIKAAKAIGMDKEVGSLEVGKKADIIRLNVRQPHLAPFGNMPIERVVYHAMGQDVNLVIIDGQVAMEQRALTQTDENKILTDAQSAYETMMRRLDKPYITQNPYQYTTRLYEK